MRADRRKGLGAYYTPPAMAQALADWAIRERSDRAMDPSFGGLVFLEAAASRLRELGCRSVADQIWGADIDARAHNAAIADPDLPANPEQLLLRDFLAARPGKDLPLAEAVIGNPPYVRYQGWRPAKGAMARLQNATGVRLTRLASLWAPFVLQGVRFVAPGGRYAQVLPAELIHAQYASPILDYLEASFGRVGIAVFEERVFPGAQEEVVLLLADERGADQTATTTAASFRDLESLRLDELDEQMTAVKPRARGKLLAGLISEEAQQLLVALTDETQTLGDLATVRLGAVTGANDFFLVDQETEQLIPDELLHPAVSKANHVRGARFDDDDVDAMRAKGQRYRMLIADERAKAEIKIYLAMGEEAGIPERYKCRVRDPWWRVPLPSHGVPDLYLTYCAAAHPRLTANAAGALHTNTVHGVNLRNGMPAEALSVGFYNSLTLLSAELQGRSYGGGVLKLEPTEGESLAPILQ